MVLPWPHQRAAICGCISRQIRFGSAILAHSPLSRMAQLRRFKELPPPRFGSAIRARQCPALQFRALATRSTTVGASTKQLCPGNKQLRPLLSAGSALHREQFYQGVPLSEYMLHRSKTASLRKVSLKTSAKLKVVACVHPAHRWSPRTETRYWMLFVNPLDRS